MNMDGKRFAVGLAAGLLVALAVVAGSGIVTTSAAPLYGGLRNAASTSTVVTTASVTTTGAPPLAFGTSTNSSEKHNLSGNLSSLSSNLNSVNSSTTSATGAQPSSYTPRFSSSLANASQLPTPSRALLLAPILAGFILGALIYRASRSRQEREGD
jgi:hypothetical protein